MHEWLRPVPTPEAVSRNILDTENQRRALSAPQPSSRREIPENHAVEKLDLGSKSKPEGPVRLIVRSPAHSEVRTSGFGSFFPAGRIHLKDSAGVVSADDCTLSQEDHYHIRRASVSMEPLSRLPAAAKKALTRLRDDPDEEGAVRRFQRALRPLMSNNPDLESSEATRQVAVDRRVTIEDCSFVQTGDGSTMNKTNKYVAEVTELSVVDVLVEDKKLVKAFARTLREPTSDSAASSFYRGVATVAGQVDELTWLTQAPDLQQVPHTGLFSFFGFASVRDATAVMVGFGNRLDAHMKIEMPTPAIPTAAIKDLGTTLSSQLRPRSLPSHDIPHLPNSHQEPGGLGLGGTR